MTSLKYIKSTFNSSYKREKELKFLMKAIGKILPVNSLLKKWNLSAEQNCPYCGEIETVEHTLGAQCQEEFLLNCITIDVGKSFITGVLNSTTKKWIIERIFKNWTFRNAMGILNEEVIQELQELKCSHKCFVDLTKISISIGYKIWKKRCYTMSVSKADHNLDIP